MRKLKRAGVEAVAISLLFSFLHPEHEERIASALASLDVPLSISSRILPEYREYERTSTVVINAYLQPLMGRYLKRYQNHAKVQSSTCASCNLPAAAFLPMSPRSNRCARFFPVHRVALSARCERRESAGIQKRHHV